jgi:hypothetical protein
MLKALLETCSISAPTDHCSQLIGFLTKPESDRGMCRLPHVREGEPRRRRVNGGSKPRNEKAGP